MPKRRTTTMTDDERIQLEWMRDHHDKPYMRERASAMLQIDSGKSPHYVAKHGLLKQRDPDSVYTWLDRFEEAGIDGLKIEPGRGRKPAFSP
jgi:transposase